MARFFVSEDLIKNNTVTVTGSDVKHITKVLRLKPGAVISLLTENGSEFEAKITEINNWAVECSIIAQKQVSTEAPVRITLYQGLPKADKMEMIIQKSTELGVVSIVPVICDRSIAKIDEKKASIKVARWQRIAEEAAKQSRRSVIPVVREVLNFKDALSQLDETVLAIMPWEEEQNGGIKKVLITNKNKEAVALFIGPEGGFTSEEAALAREKGVFLVSLGPRILRTETAGIAVAALILYELGDLGGTGIV
jgi:16S rRNA (uracil1498-N3)-methyltransferase